MLLLTCVLVLQSQVSDELLQKLRSDQADVRESATRELRRLGEQARPQLEVLSKTTDPEVASRARKLLTDLDADVAEGVFRKLENNLLHAKTVSINFTATGTLPNSTLDLTGSLLLKEGGKVRLAATSVLGKERTELLVLCDGRTTWATASSWPVDQPTAEGALQGDHGFPDPHSSVAADIAKGFMLLSQTAVFNQLLTRIKTDGKITIRLGTEKTVGGFKLGSDDGPKKTLAYEIRYERDPDTIEEVRLWYDPEKALPFRRLHLVKTNGATKMTVNEQYPEFILNADIPDEKFQQQEKK